MSRTAIRPQSPHGQCPCRGRCRAVVVIPGHGLGRRRVVRRARRRRPARLVELLAVDLRVVVVRVLEPCQAVARFRGGSWKVAVEHGLRAALWTRKREEHHRQRVVDLVLRFPPPRLRAADVECRDVRAQPRTRPCGLSPSPVASCPQVSSRFRLRSCRGRRRSVVSSCGCVRRGRRNRTGGSLA